MAHYSHFDGEKRTCPYCGQAATFSQRTRIPGNGVQRTEPGGQYAVSEYRPGWTCENTKCSHRFDFN